MLYVMEYRANANEWLSDKVSCTQAYGVPPIPRLEQVKLMLIADKVQNFKDFLKYHKGTHPRSDDLEIYFRVWLARLNVSDTKYNDIVNCLNDPTATAV